MAPTDLVARLIARPPRYLSELEVVTGPIHMSFANADHENFGFLHRPRGPSGEFSADIPRLSIHYAFDRHHERPERPRDVRLTGYSLALRGARAEVDAMLEARFGAPRAWVADAIDYRAFHPYYTSCHPRWPEGFSFAWHEQVPEFAIPPCSAEARRAWLGELARVIAGATSVDEIDAFCRTAGSDVGIEIRGTYNSSLNRYAEFTFPLSDARDYHLAFKPPATAADVVEAFGWEPALGYSGDVHMSSWYVERRGDGWRPISGKLDHWEIEARLRRWPSGAKLPARGPCTPRMLGKTDEIVSLAVSPRFR